MNNKARYNRIKDRIASLSDAEKTDIVCGRNGIAMAEGPESVRRDTGEKAGPLTRRSEKGTAYPSPSMLACGFDTEITASVAASLAEELRLNGTNLLLGPSAAIMRSPLDGKNSQRFSEEPYLTGKMAASFLLGLRRKGIEGCLTEFGCGHSEDGAFTEDNVIDPAVFGDLYMESFRIAVSEGEATALLLSAGKLNGRRLWKDSETMRRLRKEAGFDGAVIMPAGFETDAALAVASGTDLFPGASEKSSKKLAEAVKKGKLESEVLDAAAIRAYSVTDSLRSVPVVTEHDEKKAFNMSRRAARDCMVLLKNDDGFLPLGEGKTAVIGYAAQKKPEELFRMFSITEASGQSLLEGLSEYAEDIIYAKGYNEDGSTNPNLVREARKALKEAGRGILAVCLPSGAESEGYDRRNMKLPDGVLRLADFLAAERLPLACVVMTGSAVEMPFAYGMKSILFTGRCGDAAGSAAAEILTGRANPSGRLSFTWPAKAEMTTPKDKHIYSEIYATGHRAAEFGRTFEGYPFGYGLSYSEVEFLGARIDKHVIIGERQKADILFRIRNSGDRASSFTAQVYLRRGSGRMRKLVAFKKVHILPGQTRNEHVEVEAPRFMEFDPVTGEKVFCAGQYTLELATQCDDAGVLDSFEMSVFPKEWNTVETAEERAERVSSAVAKTQSSPKDKNESGDDISFNDVRRTMAGRAVTAEIEELADDTERPYHEEWKKAVLSMPVAILNRLAGNPIDTRLAARAVKETMGKRTGGLRFGK